MNRKPVVTILKVGTISFEPDEIASGFTHRIKADMGIGGGSTVVLIEAGRKIIVDTGFDREWLDTPDNNKSNAAAMVNALETAGIRPEDIAIVFLTHWHRDHFGNLEVFNKAGYMAANGVIDRFGLRGFTGMDDGEEISEGVRVMFTPGHTVDHASIIVDTKTGDLDARVAVAGDAVISYSYYQSGHIWRHNSDFHDSDTAFESILRLADVSDIIIPGHGSPFMTYKPEWMKGIGKKGSD